MSGDDRMSPAVQLGDAVDVEAPAAPVDVEAAAAAPPPAPGPVLEGRSSIPLVAPSRDVHEPPRTEHPADVLHAELHNGTDGDVLVRVVPPEGGRVASDVICIVDVSGSMGSSADLANEATGLCVLDIVRHALKTVVNSLNPSDRVAIVPFSSSASVALPLTHADDEGKAAATAALDGLQPGGGTVMCEGIQVAFGVEGTDPTRPVSVLLLTDGVPGDQGHRDLLQSLLATRAEPVVLSTFGFGYQLDSALLEDLAIIGGGQYSFIPDIGLVGTVFVHSCANLLCRMAAAVTITASVEDGVISAPYFPGAEGEVSAGGRQLTLSLPLLQYGQPRDVVLHLEQAPGSTLDVVVSINGAEPVTATAVAEGEACAVQRMRGEVVRAIAGARQHATAPQAATEAVVQAVARMRELGAEDEDDGQTLLEDLEGQVAEAISRTDWFTKWGRHYLPSLQRAHMLQQCNNFKDPGVQGYGGTAFKEVRDAADEIFLKIPAPQPTQRGSFFQHRGSGAGGSAPAPAAPVDMNRYLDRYGGCFASGAVLLADGCRKPIQAVEPGDRVQVGDGRAEVVQCVVEMRYPAGVRALTVDLGDVVVTPWHPVRAPSGAWEFPAHFAAPELRDVPAVYSLLLTGGAFTIGDWEAVGLGHGFTDGVAAHAFFGSRAAVVASLAHMRGFSRGRVVLSADCMDRGTDGLVCGYRPQAELFYEPPHVEPLQLPEAQPEPVCA